uniref:Myb/SANT-like domain-containing protein n=1 Tax=Triticum aestivum TaxID=4565 RepID=A0A3B6NJP4_WHEAT
MGKHKLTLKTEEDSNPRDKYITWTDEATRFMLEWYIDLRKDKPATFKFNKQHHLQCADALNGKFSLAVTQTQVDRHYHQCKEKWGWVRRAMANSGNGLDRTTQFTLSESEKQRLNSHADGSLAVDQTTVNVDDGSDDSEDVRELEGNLILADSDEADSDTIDRRSPKVDLDGNPLNKKRKCASSSPSKKPTKGKANKKGKVSNDDMVTSIKKLAESLASPIVSVQPMPPVDPYANLWKRINALTIPAKDKLEIVAYLSKPDQDIFRSYLNYADETILREWVISYFEPQFHEGGNDGSAAAH